MEPLAELSQSIARRAPPDPVGTWKDEALGLIFGTASYIPEPTLRVYQPVFALVVQGEKQLVLGDKVFTCGKGTFIVVSVDLPITFQISRATPQEPYMAFALTLKPAAVATLLLEAASADHFPDETEAAGLGVSNASTELLEALVRYIRLLDQPRDLPVLGPIAEKEIVWRLLCSEQGHRLRQIGLADSRLSQIGRAMRWMREHYSEAPSIEELARLSAMSVTSFHRHFRAVALMSPLQYLKQIRLQQARARLLANADDIATVGHSVGYDSPSQFSREYKRAYGAPPGQDARLLRASSSKS
jgi:AraC-like DNA-binding protein